MCVCMCVCMYARIYVMCHVCYACMHVCMSESRAAEQRSRPAPRSASVPSPSEPEEPRAGDVRRRSTKQSIGEVKFESSRTSEFLGCSSSDVSGKFPIILDIFGAFPAKIKIHTFRRFSQNSGILQKDPEKTLLGGPLPSQLWCRPIWTSSRLPRPRAFAVVPHRRFPWLGD